MKKIDFSKANKLVSSFLKPNSNMTQKRAVLVRSCENQGNLSGTICGWTDMKLTDYGRRQAFELNQVYELNKEFIHQVHSSDLQRCIDSSFYALGFPSKEDLITNSKLLRELNFGDQEGLHYDGLTDKEKEEINSPDYQAPNGESREEVQSRLSEFIFSLDNGNHLIFTHGGLITVGLNNFGIDSMPTNGSLVGVQLGTDGIESLEFEWEFPVVQEDI